MNSHHQKGQNVTFTNHKSQCEEHKGNKKVNFSPFLESIWWKKEWDSAKSKIVDELSKLTNNGVVLFWKKQKLPNSVLFVIFINRYYKGKYNF